MKTIRDMNQAELAAYVQNQLRSRGIEVVLSGGAVVGIYSNDLYVSKGIDLVNVDYADRQQLEEVMEEIGFVPIGRHFEHPCSDQVIEFSPGPLTIGSEKVKNITEMMLKTGRLRTLSPTDCVKDRLAHFFHWNDRQCLCQAKLVAANHKIDIDDIRNWAINEGFGTAFRSIQDDLT
jgi:hypothetical protein